MVAEIEQVAGGKCSRCRNCKCNTAGKPKKAKKKRAPSAYNKHISKEMKSGKSMKQAAASWKAQK